MKKVYFAGSIRGGRADAELKGISAEEVIATTEENARRMYRLDPV